jgi:hypothetical protein
LCDAPIADAQVGLEAAAFVDEFGVLDQPLGHSVFSVGVPAAPQREVFGDRIFTAFAQRLAAQDTPCRKQAAAQWPMACDRDARVGGARRIKPAACAQQGAQQALVGGNQEQQEACHGRAPSAWGKGRGRGF